MDRLILLVAWIVTCGLVYFLGFYVGNSTQARRLGLEERVVRLPVTSQPPPEGTRPKSEDQFVFYDKLMGDGGGTAGRDTARPPAPALPAESSRPAPPPAAAPARAATPPSPPPAASASTKQLASTTPPPAPAHAPATPPPRPVHASAEAPARAAPPREVAKASVPPAPTPPPAPAVARPGSTGPWTVLANPTRNRDEADELSRQLRSRGYEATLVRVVRDGDTWYRVQVGRFPSAEAAAEVMHRLRDHEGVPHAFVASE